MKITKQDIKELARDVMRTADRRGYGLGECGYYFEVCGWDMIVERGDDDLETYDMYTSESINYSERKRLQAERPDVYQAWRELVDGAEEMADTLSEMGITTIN